ncbi:MAG: VCBS repeat-containing protein, partial [Candidatus Omnitrophica bacterium]|nr:VCBS repeat-containing protein [Candidatus Omnitrophota bacterium]
QTALAGSETSYVAIGDLNGDGFADLVTANNNSTTDIPSLSVSRNTTSLGGTSASFGGAQIRNNTEPDLIYGLALSDMNLDGRLDIVVGGVFGSDCYVAFNETAAGATSFSFTTEQSFSASTVGAFEFSVDDINQDGKPDVVVADINSNTIGVLLNTTTQFSTTASFSAAQEFTVGFDPRNPVTGDINQDQKPDIVVPHYSFSGSVSVLLNTTPPSDATVTFASALTLSGLEEPDNALLVDLNADGALDLVVEQSGKTFVYRNTTPPGGAMASFAAPQMLGFDAGSFAAGDLNGDGKKDFVIGNNYYLNETPALATTFAFTRGSISGGESEPVLGDLNNNGIPDLAGAPPLLQGDTNTTVVMNNTTPVDLTLPASSTGTIEDDDDPDSVTVAAGNNQSTLVNTAFSTNLAVDVMNANGALVEGVNVTFTAPGSGASGAFGGSTTIATDTIGRATAPTFTANGTTGAYQVTAQASGGSNPSAPFDLTNIENTPTPTPTFTATNTPTSTDTPTNSPTPMPTDTDTPTSTATPSDTPTDGPTATPTDTPTDGPSPTPTDTATDGPTPTATDTPTDGPSPTPTDTITPGGPTLTPTNTPDGPTSTPTDTATEGPSPTPTETMTPGGPTLTPTDTPDGPSPTPTGTATEGPSPTATDTPTEGPSPTPTDTITPGGPTLTPTNEPNEFAPFDLAPPPEGDGKIDVRDLLYWFNEVKDSSPTRDLLFDFSRFWQSEHSNGD